MKKKVSVKNKILPFWTKNIIKTYHFKWKDRPTTQQNNKPILSVKIFKENTKNKLSSVTLPNRECFSKPSRIF